MPQTCVRAASALPILSVVLFAAACDDGDSEYERERAADNARHFNTQQRIPETVTPGPAASPPVITATATPPPNEYRYATAAPIAAVFDQAKCTTTYTLTMTGLFPQGGFVKWTGPNCGTT